MKQIDIFLSMIPPTATAQEKGINFKTKNMYQKDASSDARNKLRAYLIKHIPEEPMTGPLRMEVIWGFPETGKHQNGTWCTNKPDLDNAQKLLQDVMKELEFYPDDKNIVLLESAKLHTYHPGISIRVTQLEKNANASCFGGDL